MDANVMRKNIMSKKPWYKADTVNKWSDSQVLKIYSQLSKDKLKRVDSIIVTEQQPQLFTDEIRLNPIYSLIRDYSKKILSGKFEVGEFAYGEWVVKCSHLRQGFCRAMIYKENSCWTVSLIQSNPSKVTDAGSKVMVYLENSKQYMHITRQVRKDKDGLKLLFFDKPDSHGRPTTMILEAC